uniref:Uncharacterized protein n=1 Tax=Populus trichocarpa TaxID=3694 RepID=A0A3N7F9R5_POPTR
MISFTSESQTIRFRVKTQRLKIISSSCSPFLSP